MDFFALLPSPLPATVMSHLPDFVSLQMLLRASPAARAAFAAHPLLVFCGVADTSLDFDVPPIVRAVLHVRLGTADDDVDTVLGFRDRYLAVGARVGAVMSERVACRRYAREAAEWARERAVAGKEEEEEEEEKEEGPPRDGTAVSQHAAELRELVDVAANIERLTGRVLREFLDRIAAVGTVCVGPSAATHPGWVWFDRSYFSMPFISSVQWPPTRPVRLSVFTERAIGPDVFARPFSWSEAHRVRHALWTAQVWLDVRDRLGARVAWEVEDDGPNKDRGVDGTGAPDPAPNAPGSLWPVEVLSSGLGADRFPHELGMLPPIGARWLMRSGENLVSQLAVVARCAQDLGAALEGAAAWPGDGMPQRDAPPFACVQDELPREAFARTFGVHLPRLPRCRIGPESAEEAAVSSARPPGPADVAGAGEIAECVEGPRQCGGAGWIVRLWQCTFQPAFLPCGAGVTHDGPFTLVEFDGFSRLGMGIWDWERLCALGVAEEPAKLDWSTENSIRLSWQLTPFAFISLTRPNFRHGYGERQNVVRHRSPNCWKCRWDRELDWQALQDGTE